MGKKQLSKRVLPMALAAAMVFTSVPVMAAPNDLSGHWAEKVMTEWQEKGLIRGYEDGSVKPDNAVSRAEFVIMMNNALGLKGGGKVSFTDVKEGDWYYNAVATAVTVGYCKGYDDGSFKPGATITRAEAAIMIANAAGLKANAVATATFKDAAAIPAWAKGSVGAVVEAGFMSGYPDGTFGAAASIKRAEAVSSLNRVMGSKADTPVVPEEEEKTETDNKKGSGGGGGGSSSGGGSGSGGGTTPTVPTVTTTVDSAAKLDIAIEDGKADQNLVINVTAALNDADIEAEFDGKELTINFNDFDMTGKSLKISAPDAEKITLNDTKDGTSGTEVGVLTIDAPNAEVVSYVVADTVNIDAVKYGTFHAKDKVEKIEIKQGAVKVDEDVAEDTEVKVTVPEGATGNVKIAGKVNEVTIGTSEHKVALDAEVTTANVTAENAEVTVGKAAVIETVNIEETAGGAIVAGEGTVTTANVSAAATVETAKVATLEVKEPVEVTVNAAVTTANVTAEGAKVSGEGSIATANVSAAATIDTKTVEKLDVTAPVTVTVGENAAVETVVVSAAADGDVKTEITGSGTVAKIEAEKNVTVSATNVTEVAVGSGVTAELKSDVASVTVPSTATEVPTIKVEDGVKVDTVTTEANVNVTGSGSITNVTVNSSENEKVTITAPEDSAIKVESVVNTGSGEVDINNESKNEAELPSDVVTKTAVVDTVETVPIDLATSDEWRTEGYVYEFFDISFEGAEWAVTEEDFDWDKVTYWVNGEQFQWIPGVSVVGDYAVEVDIMNYYYDAEAETGYAQGLIAAYEANVKAGETYKGEIRFPSSYLKVKDGYAINSGKTFAVDFDVTIADSGTKLTPAKDTLSTLTISPETAADWRTEGYVYIEEEITFDGAEWSMEPYWEEHVTYWIDGEQFQWIPGESVVGDYAVEVEMVPEYDEQGTLSMKAMVFAYVEKVREGGEFNVEIKVPTYSLKRTDDNYRNYRITRNETAVIDFKVKVDSFAEYSLPVVDTVEDVYIDLSASDEWRTDGYLYQFFDINFNAAEWAVEDLNWDEVEYYVNGEKFEWIVEGDNPSEPGDFAVEADVFYYDGGSGYALGLIAAYVDEGKDKIASPGETYEVEIHFPSDDLRITEKGYEFKNGETVVVDFNVHIVDSEEEHTPAKDKLDVITIDLETADEWQTEGYVYVEKEITFNGAGWFMEPYWDAQHVTYWIDGEQFVWDGEKDWPGKYDVEVDMFPKYDEQGNLTMKAMVFAYVDNVEDGDSYNMEIRVPTYCLERTDDAHRITRDTAVIDFKVNITGSAPEQPSIPEDVFYAEVAYTEIDCNMNEDGTKVEDGSVTVTFDYGNWTKPVTFGLMLHDDENYDDDEVVIRNTFETNEVDGEGSVTLVIDNLDAESYEVVYLVGDTWYGTSEYINIPEDALSVKVTGTKVDCKDNGETVESGTITVTFTFKNYMAPVTLGLMDRADHVVKKDILFTREDDTTGSVTFEMEGVPVAVYEVVYLIGETKVGTGAFIDLTEKDEPEVDVNFTLNYSDGKYYLTWNDVGYENYQVRILDGDTKMTALPDTDRTDSTEYDLLHFIPCADENKSYDIVLREQDGNKTILARLEGALKVTVSGAAVEYNAEFSATGATATWVEKPSGVSSFFELKRQNGDIFIGGGTPVPDNMSVNTTLTGGEVLDMRVVTEASLAGQVLSVTITPASKTTYEVTE